MCVVWGVCGVRWGWGVGCGVWVWVRWCVGWGGGRAGEVGRELEREIGVPGNGYR